MQSMLETRRLTALRSYQILDTPREPVFDHIVEFASHLLGVPVAAIGFVDRIRTWFKSTFGTDIHEIRRNESLCSLAIEQDGFFEIPDLHTHPLLAKTPVAAGLGPIRYYAAIPLKTDEQYAIGTLCVADFKPRSMTEVERKLFQHLGDLVVEQLDLHARNRFMFAQQNNEIGRITHELKNAMTVIPAYADIINNTSQEKTTIELVQLIKIAATKMKGLVEGMLQSMRGQHAFPTLNKSYFSLNQCIEKCIATNRVLSQEKNQRIITKLAPRIQLIGDERRIAEAFDNLINNAVKYSKNGAEIIVESHVTAHHVLIEVIDEGPGFATEDFDRVFQPFSKLSADPTGGETSTGVGLYVVKILIEMHGGTVSVQNNPDRGARFIIRLPVSGVLLS